MYVCTYGKRLKRNGKVIEVNIEEIVCGDIVLLSSGDKVPADGVLIKGSVSIDESSINGETKDANKEVVNLASKKINDKNKIIVKYILIIKGFFS